MPGYGLSEKRKPSGVKAKVRKALGAKGLFFKGFMENPVMVGSIIPSSKYTIRKMLAPVDWGRCRLFVEYGPGVGTFCQPVLDRLDRDAMLIVIDTNKLFIDYLKRTIHDPRFVAVHGSAADVESIVHAHGHDHADYVLSGLPFSTLPPGVGPGIAQATYRALRPGGAFLTYQFGTAAGNLMKRHFDRQDRSIEMRNVPPCFLAWSWKEG